MKPNPYSFISPIQHLFDRQKKIDWQLLVTAVLIDWIYAYLIISIQKSYRNLNGANARQMLVVMLVIFLISLFLKFFLWLKSQEQRDTPTDIKSAMLLLRHKILYQRSLVLTCLFTFLALLAVGCIYYFNNRPVAIYLLLVIAAPVGVAVFTFCGVFIFRLKHQLRQVKRTISKIATRVMADRFTMPSEN